MIAYPISTAGINSRVVEAGDGAAEVWFVHGVGGRADRWTPSLELLARQGFRCRALDLPGHGFASRAPDFDYSVDSFTRFVASTIEEQAEGERVALVGTSFGALLAAGAALRLSSIGRAPRIAALILCAPMGVIPLGQNVCSAIADRLTQVDPDQVRARLSFMHHPNGHEFETAVEEELRIATSPGTADAFAKIAHTIRTEVDEYQLINPLRRWAAQLPMQQIWGTDDRSIPVEVGLQIARMLPEMQAVELAGVGHLPYLQVPERFTRCIANFLRENTTMP